MILPLRSGANAANKLAFTRYYGRYLPRKLDNCVTCHVVASAPGVNATLASFPHNAFGKRLALLGDELRKAGKKTDIPTRLKLIAREDADGDGIDNETELLLGHLPGDPTDKPTASEIATSPELRSKFAKFLSSYRWEPFETVRRPQIPAVRTASYSNPIDHFLAIERISHNVKPSPEADKTTLLRRVTLDLTGLQPTPAEIQAYLDDRSPRAYDKVVDRLLASPRYGERWGRHWMDVWRYSDWAGWADGGQIRDSQPHIWRWRDWIVESLNLDKGYDRMVQEMLAADELCPEDTDALRATGFLARNYKLLSREQWLEDTVNHTSKAFLGLTVHCAKCHNHVYDPISQVDYYKLRAIFEPHNVRIMHVPGQQDTKKDGLVHVVDADPKAVTHLFIRGDERNPDNSIAIEPAVPTSIGGALNIQPVALPRDFQAPERRAFETAEAVKSLDEVRKSARAAYEQFKSSRVIDTNKLEPLKLEMSVAEAKYASLLALLAVEQLEDAGKTTGSEWTATATAATVAQRKEAIALAERDVFASLILVKANELSLTAAETAKSNTVAKLKADLVAAKAKLDSATKSKLTAVAEMQKPLTTAFTPRYATTGPAVSTGRRLAFARWLTANSNPLTARVAVNQMWMRHFGVGIVPSMSDFGRNGRQPSHPQLLDWLSSELMQNRWQMKPLHRLMVTSAAYKMASGFTTANAINAKVDPDNIYLWRANSRRLEAELVRDNVLYSAGMLDETIGGAEIDNSLGLTSRRRSIYLRHAAEKDVEFLQIFDGPSVTECYERKVSVMPQQALAMANSPLTVTLARKIAREQNMGVQDVSAIIKKLFIGILARQATNDEVNACKSFLEEQQRKFGVRNAAVEKPVEPDLTKASVDPKMHSLESLALVLFNHNDFVTIR